MSTELATMGTGLDNPGAMVAVVRNRLACVRELLKSELKGPSAKNPDGVDYGVVPGTKKLTLLQPGAEKIAMMFQFVASYEITRTELPGGHLEVTALCTLTHGPSGNVVGQAEGSASTMESKHRYRGAAGKVCPECGATACVPSKKEYGGGYFCREASGGCGKRWKPGTEECAALDEQASARAENMDPADQRNTVTKIAQKRAFVSVVKGASAASDIFTVDIEDGAPLAHETRPPVAMPVEKAPAAQPHAQTVAERKGEPDGGVQVVEGKVEEVRKQTGTKKTGEEWTIYKVIVRGITYGTFDVTIATDAKEAKASDLPVRIEYETDAKGYHNIRSLLVSTLTAEPDANPM